MDFSNRLLELRKSRNLTQRQVYEGIGMSPIGYQRYEYGTREPAYRQLLAIADFFNVSTDYLLGRTDNPNLVEDELTIFRGLDTNERNALVKFAEFLRSSHVDNPAVNHGE